MTEGAHVEIVDPKAIGGVLAPSQVLINGVDVGLVSADGVRINVGDSRTPTEVTLTLFPSRVTIRGKDEATHKRWGSVTDPEPPPPPR